MTADDLRLTLEVIEAVITLDASAVRSTRFRHGVVLLANKLERDHMLNGNRREAIDCEQLSRELQATLPRCPTTSSQEVSP